MSANIQWGWIGFCGVVVDEAENTNVFPKIGDHPGKKAPAPEMSSGVVHNDKVVDFKVEFFLGPQDDLNEHGLHGVVAQEKLSVVGTGSNVVTGIILKDS